MTTPVLVNSTTTTRTDNSATPTTLTTGMPSTTAGNCIVVTAVVSTSYPGHSPGGDPTITGMAVGGLADNFASILSKVHTPELVMFWVDRNCAGGKTTLTLTGTLMNEISLCIMEFSGLTTGDVHLTGSSGSGSSTTVSTGSYTTSGPALSVALLSSQGANFSGSTPFGWTVAYADPLYLAKHLYRFDTVGGTLDATMSKAAATNWTAGAAALRPKGLYSAASVTGLAVANVATIDGLDDVGSFNGLT